MINIVEVYGMIQDYKMLEIMSRLLGVRMNINSIFASINYQVDLRNEIVICESEDETYLMNWLVDNPEEIITERKKRKLYYKEYTMQGLEENKIENLIEKKEAQEVLKFLKKRGIEYAVESTLTIILHIMTTPQMDIKEFLNLIKIDFKDIDEANEYIQLIMDLHNNIPHYLLCERA